MPNWCSNHVSITGNADQLTAFVLAAKTDRTDISFTNLYPCPQPLMDADSGSSENYHTILYGNISSFVPYSWIPDEIKNDREALLAFVATRGGITVDAARKIGELMQANLETYGYKNWYDWSIANWGTKWDIEGSGDRYSDDHASYDFQSAWSPPIEAFVEISRAFPDLTFDLEYCEPGGGFCGRAEIKGGEIVDQIQNSFSSYEDMQRIIDSGDYDAVESELEVQLEAMREWERESELEFQQEAMREWEIEGRERE